MKSDCLVLPTNLFARLQYVFYLLGSEGASQVPPRHQLRYFYYRCKAKFRGRVEPEKVFERPNKYCPGILLGLGEYVLVRLRQLPPPKGSYPHRVQGIFWIFLSTHRQFW